MESKINKMKNYQWLGKLIIGFLVGIITSTWFVFSTYNDFKKQNEEIHETLKTTQQMALKSVIWNDDIPIGERAGACDVYLTAGYNSLTKKECEKIIGGI